MLTLLSGKRSRNTYQRSALYSTLSLLKKNYIHPLIVQGNLLRLVESESSDLTWKSVVYDLLKGVLSFAVRSTINFLPTFNNLRIWGNVLTLLVNYALIKRLSSTSSIYVLKLSIKAGLVGGTIPFCPRS